MSKLVVAVALVVTLTGCAYNPSFYEETRKMDNSLHNQSMGWFIVSLIKNGERKASIFIGAFLYSIESDKISIFSELGFVAERFKKL